MGKLTARADSRHALVALAAQAGLSGLAQGAQHLAEPDPHRADLWDGRPGRGEPGAFGARRQSHRPRVHTYENARRDAAVSRRRASLVDVDELADAYRHQIIHRNRN